MFLEAFKKSSSTIGDIWESSSLWSGHAADQLKYQSDMKITQLETIRETGQNSGWLAEYGGSMQHQTARMMGAAATASEGVGDLTATTAHATGNVVESTGGLVGSVIDWGTSWIKWAS